jgi:hypothetical protein
VTYSGALDSQSEQMDAFYDNPGNHLNHGQFTCNYFINLKPVIVDFCPIVLICQNFILSVLREKLQISKVVPSRIFGHMHLLHLTISCLEVNDRIVDYIFRSEFTLGIKFSKNFLVKP